MKKRILILPAAALLTVIIFALSAPKKPEETTENQVSSEGKELPSQKETSGSTAARQETEKGTEPEIESGSTAAAAESAGSEALTKEPEAETAGPSGPPEPSGTDTAASETEPESYEASGGAESGTYPREDEPEDPQSGDPSATAKETAPTQESKEPETPAEESKEPEETPAGSSAASEKKILKYEEFLALTPEQKDQYLKSFESHEAFFEWYIEAQASFSKEYPEIEIGPDGTIDLSKLAP